MAPNGEVLLLASSSPRRSQLLREAGIPYRVVPSEAEELTEHEDGPRRLSIVNAGRKSAVVAVQFPHDYVLGADTVVTLDGKIYGKPADRDEAFAHLQALSGRTHEVITGVVIRHGERVMEFAGSSQVVFRELCEAEIEAYLRDVEVMDKAGAYAIQEEGARIVERVEGEIANVMGLPIRLVLDNLVQMGFRGSALSTS